MKVIYIADDGTQFEDKWDCEEYEWILNHPNIKSVEIYDGNDNKLTTYMSSDTYENADLVIVPDMAALSNFHELARLTGFCCYHQIETIGTWEFKMDRFVGRYVKKDSDVNQTEL